MLFLIGTGLGDGKDITVRGKEAIASADYVYLEGYTSLLQCSHKDLEKELNASITLLTREDVEQRIEPILEQAETADVVVLIIGDPFGATTHTDLYLRARKKEVEVKIIHNASIFSAVGEVGLELYRYGKTVSIPYWLPGFEPTSFLDGIASNKKQGLHTLCLLDIKTDENRYMTVREGIEHLEKAGQAKQKKIITQGMRVVGVSRISCPDQVIVAGTLEELKHVDFGEPPHCIVLPGDLHPVEEEMLELLKNTTSKE